ncbi:IclR family transcriptional regulator [Vibrio sp. WJH972]
MTDKTGETAQVKVDSTLSKGLKILEALANSETEKGVTELSLELGMTKSNTFRLLRSLSVLGYVKQPDGKNYSCTMKAWQLGQRIMDHLDLPAIAAPQMRRLSRATGATIYLAVLEGMSVLYIDKIESTNPIRSWSPKGAIAPLYCVGPGKAILAEQYDLFREQLKGELTRYTDKTITTIQQLDADMAETKKRGYSIDTGEYRDQILSFGSVIKAPNGEVLGALGVSVPNINLSDDDIEKICLAVRDAGIIVSDAVAQN